MISKSAIVSAFCIHRSSQDYDWPEYSIDDARGFYNCTAAPVTIPDINDLL